MTSATTTIFTEYLQTLNDESLSALSTCIHLEQNRRRKIEDCALCINAALDELAGLVSEHDHIDIVDEFSGEVLVENYGHDDYRTLGKDSQSIFKIAIG